LAIGLLVAPTAPKKAPSPFAACRYAGQVGILRPIGNRPLASGCKANGWQVGCQPAAGCHPAPQSNPPSFRDVAAQRRTYVTIVRMLFESDKVMFEIYRETGYTGQFRVVYFTELQDHNKETEINHAMAGEHLYDGFIKNFGKDEAKEIIDGLLTRLNSGERFEAVEIERVLGQHLA
jgi:hypothetical protein